MERRERTRQYSLLFFLFACFVVTASHCFFLFFSFFYDICLIFSSAKFSLFSFSIHNVEDCQLTTTQIIDLLLLTGCFFQEREFDKHNLGQLIYHSKYGRKSVNSEYKYYSLGPIWFNLEKDNDQG